MKRVLNRSRFALRCHVQSIKERERERERENSTQSQPRIDRKKRKGMYA